jgi:hypothetical protein
MPSPPPAGYSGTPLARKLGLKSGARCLLRNVPDHYRDLFSDWPDHVEMLTNPEIESVDFIHLFVRGQEELEESITGLKPLLRKNGTLWISWPKGSSNIPTTLKREPVREIGLASGLVDVKVCAVDADWSALKFVYRKKDR